MTTTTIARPYAKAAFEFSIAKGTHTSWEKQLLLLKQLVELKEVNRFLANPDLGQKNAVDFLIQSAKISDGEVIRFLNLLAHYRRLEVLPEIYRQFVLRRIHHEQTVEIEVCTAVALDQAAQEKFIQALKKRLQRNVQVTFETDSTLIGGAVIKEGDKVFDRSLRGKLIKLQHTLLS